jgi:hypothetical protein
MKKILITTIFITIIGLSYLNYKVVFGFSPQYGISNGLVGHWSLDTRHTPWTSATAATTVDMSGNANNGTLNNMAKATSPRVGKVGQGLKFDGVDDYVNNGTNASLNFGTGAMSISAWFKSDGTIRALSSIAGKGGVYPGGKRYFLGTDWAASGNIYFTVDDDTTSKYAVSNAELDDSKWHHVVGVKDSTQLRMYVDGVLQNTTADITGYGSIDSARPFTIGSIYSETSGVQALFFPGTVDDVRVYNRALSQNEIRAIYRLGLVEGSR